MTYRVDLIVIVGVIGNVDLIAPLIVAALGHGNDTVVVIGIVAAIDVVDMIRAVVDDAIGS